MGISSTYSGWPTWNIHTQFDDDDPNVLYIYVTFNFKLYTISLRMPALDYKLSFTTINQNAKLKFLSKAQV